MFHALTSLILTVNEHFLVYHIIYNIHLLGACSSVIFYITCGFFSLILNINANKSQNLFTTKMIVGKFVECMACWTFSM